MMNANAGSPEHAIEFFHGYTYSGHPVACAAAIATLKLFKQEQAVCPRRPHGPGAGRCACTAGIKGLPTVIGIRTLGLGRRGGNGLYPRRAGQARL
jgi:beta-alanine--pyruvate transaminase